jgi:hypothetical protein
MKKVTLLMAMGIFAIAANAQTQFGVQAGALMSSYKMKAGSVSLNFKSTVGFKVGLFAEVPFGSALSFNPELNYINKGGTLDESGDKTTFSFGYLELPLNVQYKLGVGGGNVLFGAGPVLGYGLNGKTKYTYSDGSPSESETLKFGSGIDQVKAIELGANIFAGYELSSGIRFSIQGRPNFTNLNNDDGISMKNTYFGLTVGYRL